MVLSDMFGERFRLVAADEGRAERMSRRVGPFHTVRVDQRHVRHPGLNQRNGDRGTNRPTAENNDASGAQTLKVSVFTATENMVSVDTLDRRPQYRAPGNEALS
jgi:hypothetical protein